MLTISHSERNVSNTPDGILVKPKQRAMDTQVRKDVSLCVKCPRFGVQVPWKASVHEATNWPGFVSWSLLRGAIRREKEQLGVNK